MREIKFRAYDTIEKKFIGNIPLKDFRYLSQAYHLNLEYSQYTGLKDKNGKEIYEGDILLQKTTEHFKQFNNAVWEKLYTVEYGEYDWREGWSGNKTVCFYLKSIGGHSVGINQHDLINPNYPFEIIGNIYENPELLK